MWDLKRIEDRLRGGRRKDGRTKDGGRRTGGRRTGGQRTKDTDTDGGRDSGRTGWWEDGMVGGGGWG